MVIVVMATVWVIKEACLSDNIIALVIRLTHYPSIHDNGGLFFCLLANDHSNPAM